MEKWKRHLIPSTVWRRGWDEETCTHPTWLICCFCSHLWKPQGGHPPGFQVEIFLLLRRHLNKARIKTIKSGAPFAQLPGHSHQRFLNYGHPLIITKDLTLLGSYTSLFRYWSPPESLKDKKHQIRLLTSTRAPMITCQTASSSLEFIFPSRCVYFWYRDTSV